MPRSWCPGIVAQEVPQRWCLGDGASEVVRRSCLVLLKRCQIGGAQEVVPTGWCLEGGA